MNYSRILKPLSLWGLTLLLSFQGGYLVAKTGPVSIIPEPQEITLQDGQFVINPETVIIAVNDAAKETAWQLRDMLTPATGYETQVIETHRQAKNAIILRIDASADELGKEGYQFQSSANNIQITAARPAGLFYGCQTLRQLLPVEIFRQATVKGVLWSVPAVTIKDKPQFQWRGAMLDTSRHFMPKEFVLKFIDLLALHKMNSFHMHLTDDQGWRIEIKRYPKLTQIGAWRKETLVGHYGSKPQRYDGKRHGGFYTQDDIREIVAYAQARHINVVPEIEMPGHAQAAIAAYPELGTTGKKVEVSTTWGVHTNIYNADESTIRFLQNVLTEVMDLFPSKFIHIGGDEAVKNQWKASPAIQKRIKELGLKNENELQSYFIKRMDKFLTAHGRRLIGWDEILEGGLAPNATVMSWRGERGGITAAREGHDVVMAPTTYTYFDYYQSRDKKHEPLAIGGFLPLKKVYGYYPIPSALNARQAKHILGTQGQIWTEYIPGPKKVEYMAFPRLTALAEVAWTAKSRKNYPDFIQRLKVHLQRLSILDVNYRPLNKDKTGEKTKAESASAPEPAKPVPAGQIGTNATALKGLTWIKGQPVTRFKQGTIYVVEFWATWCGPCRASIPHLSEIQEQYKDKNVTVIGISSGEALDRVKPFVQEMGDKMDYTVALDDKARSASKAYMEAFKQGGIPHAFIINKQGKIVWHGHPMSGMEDVLDSILAGKFDPQEYARKQAEARAKLERNIKNYRAYFTKLDSGGTDAELKQLAEKLLADAPAGMLNGLSWNILTVIEKGKQDLPLALKAARKANDMTDGKDAGIIDTYALALFLNGKVKEAIAQETKALELIRGNEQVKQEFQKRLEQFKAALNKTEL